MRPIRCIHLDGLKYKYLSIVQTKDTMVVRVLYPMLTNDGRTLTSSNDILTDKVLIWDLLDLNGQLFQVVAEGIFDLKNPLHKQWFKSNANICFVLNAAMPNGVVSIVPQHLVAGTTYEHTPDWARREGIEVLAQLYVWSDTDTVEECAKSFAVDNKGQLFTNIPPSRLAHVDTQWMQREDRSWFVTLQHTLKCEAGEDNFVQCTLTCSNLGNKVPVCGTYLVEASCGYIPVREIQVENGEGKFAWYPLMLSQEDADSGIRILVRDVQGCPCCECIMRFSNDHQR